MSICIGQTVHIHGEDRIDSGGILMTEKQTAPKSPKDQAPLKALSELQESGFGNMLGMSTTWVEALSDMGAEVISFMAERIKEDVKTQHQILHCKNVVELQQIQSEFVQKAVEQYQAESGKLVELSSKAFAKPAYDKTQ